MVRIYLLYLKYKKYKFLKLTKNQGMKTKKKTEFQY